MPLFAKPLVNGTVANSGSLVGEYFTQDRLALVTGRMPDPMKKDEFVADALAAKSMG